MKSLRIFTVIFFIVPFLVQAQYMGGNGRGDASFLLRTFPLAADKATDLLPAEYILAQNYPNPFNPATTIKYSIAVKSFISITVYNILGKTTAVLVNEEKSAGTYEITWNAGNLPGGVYFCQLKTSDKNILTRKMILLK